MNNRYETVEGKKLRTESGIDYLPNLIYPQVPLSSEDFYVVTRAGDRYDKLSYVFYGTVDYWWIIAVANGGTEASICPKPGSQLRIPADPQEYIARFKSENSE